MRWLGFSSFVLQLETVDFETWSTRAGILSNFPASERLLTILLKAAQYSPVLLISQNFPKSNKNNLCEIPSLWDCHADNSVNNNHQADSWWFSNGLSLLSIFSRHLSQEKVYFSGVQAFVLKQLGESQTCCKINTTNQNDV